MNNELIEYVKAHFAIMRPPEKYICDKLLEQMADRVIKIARNYDEELAQDIHKCVVTICAVYIPSWALLGYSSQPRYTEYIMEMIQKMEILNHLVIVCTKQFKEFSEVMKIDNKEEMKVEN